MLHRLAWLIEHGMAKDQNLTFGATAAGDKANLQWLHEVQKCRIDERCSDAAAALGRPDLLVSCLLIIMIPC